MLFMLTGRKSFSTSMWAGILWVFAIMMKSGSSGVAAVFLFETNIDLDEQIDTNYSRLLSIFLPVCYINEK